MRAMLMAPLFLMFVTQGWSWDFAMEIPRMEVIGTETTFALEFHSPGVLGETNYCFYEGEYVRYYALMPPGGTVFMIPSVCYITKREPQVGDSWDSWMGDESGSVYTAEVVALEAVDTPYGHFPEAFVVEYTEPGSDVPLERGFYCLDVGLVRYEFLGAGATLELLDVPAPLGGSGSLPLAVGNRWEYGIAPVAVEPLGWAGIKALYRQ